MKRVLGRGPDQDHDSFFDIGQQYILLSSIEAVNLIDKQDRPFPVQIQIPASLFQQFPNLLDSSGDGIQRAELTFGMVSDHVSQGGLTGSRWSIEDQGTESIRQQHATQQFSGTEEVILTDVFVDIPRPHPGGERFGPQPIGFREIAENVNGWLPLQLMDQNYSTSDQSRVTSTGFRPAIPLRILQDSWRMIFGFVAPDGRQVDLPFTQRSMEQIR